MTEAEVANRLVPIIIGGDVLAYSFVREFHRVYGIERCVVIMTDDIKMLSSSKFTDCRIVPDAGDPQVLCDTLLAVNAELTGADPSVVTLAVGTDDAVAALLAEHRASLEAAGIVIPYEDFAKIDALSKKDVFYDLCEELDIPYPKTWYFDCGAPDTALPWDEFSFPIIAKPADSSAWKHARIKGKRKAYEIYTLEELQEVWSNITSSGYIGQLLIQDFIPGGDEALWIINMFTDETGDIRVITSGDIVLQDHCPSAIGNPLTIIGCKNQQLIDYVTRIQAEVRFHGWSTFDIKYDERNGKYVFFEMNIRPGRSSYYVSLGGVSFVKPIVEDYVLGQEVAKEESYRPFVYNIVPKYVLKHTVADRETLKRIDEISKITRPNPDPLHYSEDSLAHNFWAWLMHMNYIRKFKRYYWDTDGKQYAE